MKNSYMVLIIFFIVLVVELMDVFIWGETAISGEGHGHSVTCAVVIMSDALEAACFVYMQQKKMIVMMAFTLDLII